MRSWLVVIAMLATQPAFSAEDCLPAQVAGNGTTGYQGEDPSGKWMHWNCTVAGKVKLNWFGIPPGAKDQMPDLNKAKDAQTKAYMAQQIKTLKAKSDRFDWSTSYLPTQVQADVGQRRIKTY